MIDNDAEIIAQYCASPQLIMSRYKGLVRYGVVFPVTPEELAAVMQRVNDGTINRDGAKQVLDELERLNKLFIATVNDLVKTLS